MDQRKAKQVESTRRLNFYLLDVILTIELKVMRTAIASYIIIIILIRICPVNVCFDISARCQYVLNAVHLDNRVIISYFKVLEPLRQMKHFTVTEGLTNIYQRIFND